MQQYAETARVILYQADIFEYICFCSNTACMDNLYSKTSSKGAGEGADMIPVVSVINAAD